MWWVIAFASETCFGGILPLFWDKDLLNSLYLNPWVFLMFVFPTLSPSCWEKGEQLGGCLSAGWSQATIIIITVTAISSQGWLCCGGSVLSSAYVSVISLAYKHERRSHHHLKYWWRSILHHFPNMLQTGLCYHLFWCSVAAYLWLTAQSLLKMPLGKFWVLPKATLLPLAHHTVAAWELAVSVQSAYTACSSWTFTVNASVQWFSILNVQNAKRLQNLIPNHLITSTSPGAEQASSSNQWFTSVPHPILTFKK